MGVSTGLDTTDREEGVKRVMADESACSCPRQIGSGKDKGENTHADGATRDYWTNMVAVLFLDVCWR